MIRRILKMLGALGAGTGLTVLTQLVIPPVFLHSYGVRRYGEWLVLTGTLSYLSTLNFGLTTYATNQLTMLREQSKLEEFKRLQGSALALLCCMMAIGIAIVASIAALPLNRFLRLSTLGRGEASLTALFLGLQVLASIVGGYYNGLFMVVGLTHRGLMWAVARACAATACCFVVAMSRMAFHWLAMSQFMAVGIVTAVSVVDLRVRFGGLPLGLQGAEWRTMKRTLRPSGMFAMIFGQQILTYQMPVNLLQWILGPSAVVLFSTCRTLLSSARQVLSPITNAIAPEITFSYAHQDRKRMLALFHLSEKVVFAGIPVANLGVLLLAPLLLRIWLRRPELFDLRTYALMALISAAMSVRDHKQFFQFSTNVHHRLAAIVLGSSGAMIAVSIPVTIRYGLDGFLVVWLASECVQAGLIYGENRKLFDRDASITPGPVFRLAMVMAVSLPVCAAMVSFAQRGGVAMYLAVAGVGLTALSAESWWVFGVRDVWGALRGEPPGPRVELDVEAGMGRENC